MTLRVLRYIFTESLADARIQTLVDDLNVDFVRDLTFAGVVVELLSITVEKVGACMHVVVNGSQSVIDIRKSILIHVFVLGLEGSIFRIQYGLFAVQERRLLPKHVLTEYLHFTSFRSHTEP